MNYPTRQQNDLRVTYPLGTEDWWLHLYALPTGLNNLSSKIPLRHRRRWARSRMLRTPHAAGSESRYSQLSYTDDQRLFDSVGGAGHSCFPSFESTLRHKKALWDAGHLEELREILRANNRYGAWSTHSLRLWGTWRRVVETFAHHIGWKHLFSVKLGLLIRNEKIRSFLWSEMRMNSSRTTYKALCCQSGLNQSLRRQNTFDTTKTALLNRGKPEKAIFCHTVILNENHHLMIQMYMKRSKPTEKKAILQVVSGIWLTHNLLSLWMRKGEKKTNSWGSNHDCPLTTDNLQTALI